MRSTEKGDKPGAPAPRRGSVREPGKLAVFVKELSERDRRRMLSHFLALDDADRYLRFGTRLPDEMISQYVQQIGGQPRILVPERPAT